MIYVVRGITGKYSDFEFWDVKAFTNKEGADNLCKQLNKWCVEKGCKFKSHQSHYDLEEVPDKDPQFKAYYDGTEYLVIPIETD